MKQIPEEKRLHNFLFNNEKIFSGQVWDLNALYCKRVVFFILNPSKLTVIFKYNASSLVLSKEFHFLFLQAWQWTQSIIEFLQSTTHFPSRRSELIVRTMFIESYWIPVSSSKKPLGHLQVSNHHFSFVFEGAW